MATTKRTTKSKATEVETKPVKKNNRIPLDTEVPCASNVKGHLTYISKSPTGTSAEWDEFGSYQYLDVRELLLMRNTQKRFFDDNWISIKDTDDGEYTADDIYKFLRVDDKYGEFYDADNIESFFDLNKEQMEAKVSKMSRGMKELLSIMAVDKFDRGEIDSIKKKDAIIEVLGIKLDEVD